jgi:hypothetical protein
MPKRKKRLSFKKPLLIGGGAGTCFPAFLLAVDYVFFPNLLGSEAYNNCFEFALRAVAAM